MTEIPQPSRRPITAHLPRIRLRLTIVYAVTLLVVLLLCSAVLRLATRDALDREFDDSLRASATLVRQFFRVEVAEYREIDATLQHIAGSWSSRIGRFTCIARMAVNSRWSVHRARRRVRPWHRPCGRSRCRSIRPWRRVG